MNETKIRASAKSQECTVRLPGICNGDPSTTVFAHLAGIRYGHGVGQKTKFGAYACSACHDAIDYRVRTSALTRDEIALAHHEATIETLCILERKGLL